jgi:hypothetical protein
LGALACKDKSDSVATQSAAFAETRIGKLLL